MAHALNEQFRFLVPFFASLDDSEIDGALTFAETRRPPCLTDASQDEAQMWFAAWVLYSRQAQTFLLEQGGAFRGGVREEKEGDLQRKYGTVDGSEDPLNFLGQYTALAKLCTGGAIMVGDRWWDCCGCAPF